jgi:mediator of RNA polymerase II transcription subunit 16
MVLGNTKWTLDFSHFLLNEIFDMADEFEDVFNDPEAFTQKCKDLSIKNTSFKPTHLTIFAVKNSSSLPLLVLLASMSRAFLRFICRGLRGVHAGFASTNPASLVGDSRVYYTEICQTLESSPVRIDVYEKFLAGVDSAVKHAYQGAGFGDAERPGPEKELLVNARIPPVLTTAVATLLRQTVPALKSEINRMAIYLGDYSWLGFGNDRRTALYRKQREVDILKKCPLRPPLPLGIDGCAVEEA